MIYCKSFQNYDEFKELFGIAEHGNGVKSRKNKILLALYKDKNIWRAAYEKENYYPFTLKSMADLKSWLMDNLQSQSRGCYSIKIMDYKFYSCTYQTDSLGGLCEDGDPTCIRYIKHDEYNDRVYKMKAGKLLKRLILENPFGKYVNETLMLWLCGEFAAEWSAFSMGQQEKYTLHTGKSEDDFEGIYGRFPRKGDFHSCMMGKGIGRFYSDFVDATAAWLTDRDGDMVARCVIFNDVKEVKTGDTWRLAERQYSSNLDDNLKKVLVLKLQAAGLIDGYKQIGAGCGDSCSFVANDGRSLYSKDFSIEFSIESGDPCPYMDSFKWYNEYEGIAYNNEDYDYDFELTETSGRYTGNRNWDSWHERYTSNDVRIVYYHGDEYTCDEDDLDNFFEVDYRGHYGELHHEEDVEFDEYTREYYLREDMQLCVDDEYHYRGDCVELYDGQYCHKDDENLVELYDGSYALIEDTVDINGEYFLEEDCTKLHDGTYCLTDDAVETDGEWYNCNDESITYDTEKDEWVFVDETVAA